MNDNSTHKLTRWPWLLFAAYLAAAPITAYRDILPESHLPLWVRFVDIPGFLIAPLLALGALLLALIFSLNERTCLFSKWVFWVFFLASTLGTYKTCSYIGQHIGK